MIEVAIRDELVQIRLLLELMLRTMESLTQAMSVNRAA